MDNCNLNLTPLGRFVMPPPMFEKQIKLESFPLFVDMFGHQIAALCADGTLILADCMSHDKTQRVTIDLDLNNVTKMVLLKEMVVIV